MSTSSPTWIPAARDVFICCSTVRNTRQSLALFLFRTSLTRQWHAVGKLSGRILFLLTNRLSSWVGLLYFRSHLEKDPRATGSVTACRVHVSWNSYCTPGGNVLKRSSRLKKTHSRFLWITGELPQCFCAARFIITESQPFRNIYLLRLQVNDWIELH